MTDRYELVAPVAAAQIQHGNPRPAVALLGGHGRGVTPGPGPETRLRVTDGGSITTYEEGQWVVSLGDRIVVLDDVEFAAVFQPAPQSVPQS